MSGLTLRHILILVLAPLQFLTSRWHEITGAGRSVGAMATDAPVLATPAGYAFLIWILIFALQTVYAGWQAHPSQREGLLHKRIGWPMVVALAAANVWMLTAIYHGNGLILLGFITIMAGAVFCALLRAVASVVAAPAMPLGHQYRVLPMLGICAGWLTLASFLNLAGVLQMVAGLPTGTILGAVATLLSALILSISMVVVLRPSSMATQAYGCAVVWGLLAVALANTSASMSPVGASSRGVAVTACAGAFLVVMAMAVALRRKS